MNITRREIIMAKHYDKEFKENALKYREANPKLSVAAVCRNLGISTATYYNWKRSADANDDQVVHRGSGNFNSDEAKENARLRRELKNTQDALEILKKAMGILAKEEQK